jgi:multidrug efflux system outer membrane protein
VALAILAVAGCAVGPNYRRPPIEMPAQWRPPSANADSLRPFYDSLARSQIAIIRTTSMRLPDTAANLDWFALFQDTVLQNLVRTAVANNLDVRTAVATIQEFRADYGIARGALFPQVSLTAEGGRQRIIFGGTQPFTFNLVAVLGNVSWELDFWGRLRRSTEAARADLLAQEENQRAVVLSLVSAVATSYLQLRQLDLALSISQQTLASRQQTYRLATRRYGQGLISELDVRQFEAEVATPAVSVADLQRQIAQTENQLSVLLGHAPGPVPRGHALPEVLARISIPTSLPSQLLEQRPDVRAAEASLAAATARIGVEEGARLPTFTITGQYGTQSTAFSNLFRDNTQVYTAFLGISVPIFTGGQLSNAVRAARARAEQARYRYEQTVLLALQDVNSALAAVRADRDHVIAQQTQADALQRGLHLANARYVDGISPYLDVLDAERGLFTAQLALTQAQLQELADIVQLYKALGGGWPVSGQSTVPQR